MKHIIFFLLLLLLCTPVIADNIPTGISYATETIVNATPTETPVANVTTPHVYRIEQGGCVQLNDTVDIAGLGWYTGYIGYYGRYFDNIGISSSNQVEAQYYIRPWLLDSFFIDSTFFGDKLGWWYVKYDTSSTTTTSGNDRLFYLAEKCELSPTEESKIVTELLNESQLRAKLVANLTTLPVKRELYTDVIMSKGTPGISYNVPFNSHRWVFGRELPPTFYDTPSENNRTTFYGKDLENLDAGDYRAYFVKPGDNGIIEEIFNTETSTIESPFRSKNDTSLFGIQPFVSEDRFKEAIANSYDDSYEMWRLSIQDPSIMATKLDQATLSNNQTLFALSGYTNAEKGTSITITMDELSINGITRERNTHTAMVMDNGGSGAYRSWNTSFIVDFNNMFPAQHYFNLTNNEGATASIPFYVYDELAKHYVPEARLRYIGNSPFIPTPTPEIQIVEKIKEVKVTVTIPVTPSQESVNVAQMKAMDAWVLRTVIIGIGVVLGGYLLVAWIRGRNYRRYR